MQENIDAIMWPSIEMAMSEPQEIQNDTHCLTAVQVGAVFLSVCFSCIWIKVLQTTTRLKNNSTLVLCFYYYYLMQMYSSV